MTAPKFKPVAPNDKKLIELIIFISNESEDDVNFGATKLNKLLFFSDFSFFARKQISITGHQYRKLKLGPAPRQLVPIVNTMQRNNDLCIKRIRFGAYVQHRPVALRAPRLNVFSAEEISIVQHWIRKLWPLSAVEISLKSHDFIGWEVTPLWRDIPYGTALVSNRFPSDFERQLGASLVRKAQECLHGKQAL